MKAATLFSGIGAPEAACPEIDWIWCAEIEPFPCWVLNPRHGASRPIHMPMPIDAKSLEDQAARAAAIKAMEGLPDEGKPNWGDVSQIRAAAVEPPELIVFGSPCQSFSVAGMRLGLDDPRGNLALVALRLVRQLRPRWVAFENVPGLLSSEGGRDFALFLRQLAECGYGWAYRVLDAQHWGVAQHRRRVFVVGYAGKLGRSGDALTVHDYRELSRISAAVLFEPGCLLGDPAPGRKAGERASAGALRSTQGGSDVDHARAEHLVPTLQAGGNRTGGVRPPGTTADTVGSLIPDVAWALQERDSKGADSDTKQGLLIPVLASTLRADNGYSAGAGGKNSRPVNVIAFDTTQITHPENRSQPQAGQPCHPLAEHGHAPAIAVSLRGREGGATAELGGEQTPAMRASQGGGDKPHVLAFDWKQIGHPANHSAPKVGDPCHPLRGVANAEPAVIQPDLAVRRLTPRECERLQGYADDFTLVPFGRRRKPAKDGPRYKALGNSMAVPVMRWILTRLLEVDRETTL